MSFSATVSEIATWSIEERIRLVQAVLDTIAGERTEWELTEAQKTEIDRRIADLEANPDNVLTWAEIKSRIKGQR
jgi:putative addiction module component (TIGR02574 family)